IAAPVIWLGSWLLLSLISVRRSFQKIKKGLKRALTPPGSQVASATPGGVPKDDKHHNIGNFIAHFSSRIPKGCAVIAARWVKSRSCTETSAAPLFLARFSAFGECKRNR